MMKTELLVALRMTVVTLILTGLVYPLAVTGIAQVVFPHRSLGESSGPRSACWASLG